VLSLEDYYIVPAIQRIINEFNRNLGNHGLEQRIFVINNEVTIGIVRYDIDGYGERAHDEDEEEVNYIPDPQSRE